MTELAMDTQDIKDLTLNLVDTIDALSKKGFPEEKLLKMQKKTAQGYFDNAKIIDDANKDVQNLAFDIEEHLTNKPIYENERKNAEFEQKQAIEKKEKLILEQQTLNKKINNIKEETEEKSKLQQQLKNLTKSIEQVDVTLNKAQENIVKFGKLYEEAVTGFKEKKKKLVEVHGIGTRMPKLDTPYGYQVLGKEYYIYSEESDKKVKRLEAELATVDTKLEQEIQKNVQAKENITKVCEELKKTLENDLTDKQLSDCLVKLKNVSPDFYSDTAAQLIEHVKAIRYNRQLDKVKQKLAEQIKSGVLKTPKDAAEIDTKVTLGAAFGATVLGAGIDTSITYSFSLKLKVSKGGDGRITVALIKANQLTGKAVTGKDETVGDAQGLTVQAAGKLNFATERVYESVDDFVAKEAGNISVNFLDSAGAWNVKNHATKKSFADATESLIMNVNDNCKVLQHRLHTLGVLDVSKTLSPVDPGNIQSFKRTWVQGGMDVSADAAFGVMSVGGKMGYDYKSVTEYYDVNFVQDLVDQPSLQKVYGIAEPSKFGFVIQDDKKKLINVTNEAAVKKLNEIDKNIGLLKSENNADELTKLNSQVYKSISALRAEYHSYLASANRLDQGMDAKKNQSVLNSMQQARGVKDRAEYVKAMSIQFASLKRLYDNSLADNQLESEESEEVDTFFSELYTPPMRMDKTRMQKVFGKTQMKKVENEIESQNPSAAFHTGQIAFQAQLKALNPKKPDVKFSAAIQYINKKLPHRPREQNIRIRFDLGGGVQPAELLDKIFGSDDVAASLGDSLTQVRAQALQSLRLEAGGRYDITFVKRANGWALKDTRRFVIDASKRGGTATIPIAATGVSAVAGFEVSTKRVRATHVYLGTNTLMGIGNAYRAKCIRGKESGWKDYLKDSGFLTEVCKNLKSEYDANSENGKDGVLTGDLKAWLGEIDKLQEGADENLKNQQLIEKVKNHLKTYIGKDTDENRKTLENTLEELIVKKVTSEDAARKALFVTKRKVEVKDIQKFAANVLATEVDDVVKEYGLDSAEVTDVATLLEVAQKKYKLSKANLKKLKETENADTEDAEADLENQMKLLKRAMGIDFDAQTMDDQLKKGDHANKELVLAKLSLKMKNSTTDDRLYLSDKVEGHLENDVNAIKVVPMIKPEYDSKINKAEVSMIVKQQTLDLDVVTAEPRIKRANSSAVAYDYNPPMSMLQKSKTQRRLRNLSNRKKPRNIMKAIQKVMEERMKRKQQQQNKNLANSRKSSAVAVNH